MTEKVKVTREQAEAIEIRKRDFTNEDTIKVHLRGWEYIKCLNGLTLDELIRSLYIGYEVEPEFKVGDWVVYEKSGRKIITKIIEIEHFDKSILTDYELAGTRQRISVYALRHATPSEIAIEERRRFFKKLGREASEYKMADVVTVDGINGLAEIVGYKNDDTVLVTYDSAESELESCISDLRLVVPVENRLDVKTND